MGECLAMALEKLEPLLPKFARRKRCYWYGRAALTADPGTGALLRGPGTCWISEGRAQRIRTGVTEALV